MLSDLLEKMVGYENEEDVTQMCSILIQGLDMVEHCTKNVMQKLPEKERNLFMTQPDVLGASFRRRRRRCSSAKKPFFYVSG